MDPDMRFWAGKRVCVTGGTGFLGWHLVQQLHALSARVRVFGLRPASASLQARLASLDCVYGDVRDPAAVREAVRECQVVFHTAGTLAFWGPAVAKMHEIHSVGTQQIVNALSAGARLVHTSSIVAVGASRRTKVLTEDSPYQLQRFKVGYVHAKKAAEEIALGAAAQGKDVVCVNPGYLIGPEDYEGSVMGHFCLRFWKGKVPLVPPGGMSFVDVRDVARGHLLAAERGQAGRRYILAGENMTMLEFAHLLAGVGGLSMGWRFGMPSWLQMVIAWVAERRAAIVQREPYPALQHARMNRYFWYYASERARAELGYRTRTVRETLGDAHRWFCEQGQLKPAPVVASEKFDSPEQRAA